MIDGGIEIRIKRIGTKEVQIFKFSQDWLMRYF